MLVFVSTSVGSFEHEHPRWSTPMAVLFPSLLKKLRERRKVEGRETHQGYKFYLGFELSPLARNGARHDGETCSLVGPYKADGQSFASR